VSYTLRSKHFHSTGLSEGLKYLALFERANDRGERKKVRSFHQCCFSRRQKANNASNGRKTLRKRLPRRLLDLIDGRCLGAHTGNSETAAARGSNLARQLGGCRGLPPPLFPKENEDL